MYKAKFVGIDYFNRPVFKHKSSGTYYCLVDHLVNTVPTQEEINAAVEKEGVTYKGYDWDGEPINRVVNVKLIVE